MFFLMQGKEPFKCCDFISLTPPENIEVYEQEITSVKGLLDMLRYRVSKLVHSSATKLQAAEDKYEAWNEGQYFDMKPMSEAFFDYIMIDSFHKFSKQFKSDKVTHALFKKMLLIHVWGIILKDGWFFSQVFSQSQILGMK